MKFSKETILFVALNINDVLYLKKIINKLNKFKFEILLISNSEFLKNEIIHDLIYINSIKTLTIKNIPIRLDSDVTKNFKYINILKNYIKISKFLSNKKVIKGYFFTEFHNSTTFQTLKFCREPVFIHSLKYLRIKNVSNINECLDQFDNKMSISQYKKYKLILFFYKIIFLKRLYLTSYRLNQSYFKSENIFKKDLYKVVGLSVKDNLNK